jgi:hypothetical protein
MILLLCNIIVAVVNVVVGITSAYDIWAYQYFNNNDNQLSYTGSFFVISKLRRDIVTLLSFRSILVNTLESTSFNGL